MADLSEGYNAGRSSLDDMGHGGCTSEYEDAGQCLLHRDRRRHRILRRNPVQPDWILIPGGWHHLRGHAPRPRPTPPQLGRVQDGPTGFPLLLCASLRRHEWNNRIVSRGAKHDHERRLRCGHFHVDRERDGGLYAERVRGLLGMLPYSELQLALLLTASGIDWKDIVFGSHSVRYSEGYPPRRCVYVDLGHSGLQNSVLRIHGRSRWIAVLQARRGTA